MHAAVSRSVQYGDDVRVLVEWCHAFMLAAFETMLIAIRVPREVGEQMSNCLACGTAAIL
jgi:hypothetical protein